MFSNPKQVLSALLLSLLIHATVFYALPKMQTVSYRPVLVQGELVAPEVETPAPLSKPQQQTVKIEPESMPLLHKAPEPRPQHKAPAPAPKEEPKKEPDNDVALPLLAEKANAATSASTNNYIVPAVPPLTHEDKLPMASRPGVIPLEQHAPTSKPLSSSEGDKTAAVDANGDDLIDQKVLGEFGRGLRDRAAPLGAYPLLAKHNGWQGTVKVLVRFARSGVAYQISVKDSSGYKVLDEQAVKMVELACAHYALPQVLTNKAFSVIVPIEFSLI